MATATNAMTAAAVAGGLGQTYFSCFIGPEPHFARDVEPGVEPGVAPDVPDRLVVTSPFWWQPGPSLPHDLFRRTGSREGFLPGYPLAWVEEPRSRMLHAFWVAHGWASMFAGLRPGDPAPALPPGLRQALYDVGILIEPDRRRDALNAWQTALSHARHQFASEGYVNLSRVLHSAQRDSLADYYRRVASEARTIGDSQCARRLGIYNEPMARFLQAQLVWLVGEIAGEAVVPSYAYFAGYRGGAELTRHVDREQCAFSISLLVDYQATPGGDSSWPIHLETAGDTVAVEQKSGDALLYRGTRLPHWRTVLGDGCSSDSVLLHYVPQDFTGPLR